MKNIIKKSITILFIITSLFIVLFFFSLIFPPLGNVVFSCIFGSRYDKVGESTFLIRNQSNDLAIYKAYNKPFLIIGPYRFDDTYNDFFFVNKKQVIRTATDKGGDAWFCLFNQLFILDDMTISDRLRVPYWDDLKCDNNSSIRLDEATNSYIYSFKINNSSDIVSLTVPTKFFTEDMLEATNNTIFD